MTDRTTRLRLQWALGVLLAVLVSLSVLAHHELMGPMGDSGATVSMPAVQPPSASQGMEAVAAHAAKSGSVSAMTAMSVASACNSEGTCSAAGVATPPLPAALPQAISIAAQARPGARVRPLPPGTGPPPPADTSSVLRI